MFIVVIPIKYKSYRSCNSTLIVFHLKTFVKCYMVDKFMKANQVLSSSTGFFIGVFAECKH